MPITKDNSDSVEKMKKALSRATIKSIKENPDMLTFVTEFKDMFELRKCLDETLIAKANKMHNFIPISNASEEAMKKLAEIAESLATKEDYRNVLKYAEVKKKLNIVDANINKYTLKHSDINGIKSEINKRAMFSRELNAVSGPIDTLAEKIIDKYISYRKKILSQEKHTNV